MSALYEDMYASHDSGARRFSYPNSPAHAVSTECSRNIEKFPVLTIQDFWHITTI